MDVTVFFDISHAGHLKKCFGIGLWKPWKSLIESQNTDVMGHYYRRGELPCSSTVSDPDSKCKRDHWSCAGAVFNHDRSLDKEDSVGLPTLVNGGCLKAFAVSQI